MGTPRNPTNSSVTGRMRLIKVALVSSLAVLLVGFAGAPLPVRAALPAPSSISLTPSVPSGSYVGSPVTWTAAATDTAPLVYQFSVAGPSARPVSIVRDFSPHISFVWAPLQEATTQ